METKKCTCPLFCEKEKNRPRTRRRNIERKYHQIQVEEILNNVPRSTDRIIGYVNGDEEQLKRIAEDLGAGLLRRSIQPHYKKCIVYSDFFISRVMKVEMIISGFGNSH